jgi:hypothetical protein
LCVVGSSRYTIQELLASVYLTHLNIKLPGDALAPQYNIYTKSKKAVTLGIWPKLRKFLQERRYANPMMGMGDTSKNPFYRDCGIFHGVDHPVDCARSQESKDGMALKGELMSSREKGTTVPTRASAHWVTDPTHERSPSLERESHDTHCI